jgi:hypothetical protein
MVKFHPLAKEIDEIVQGKWKFQLRKLGRIIIFETDSNFVKYYFNQ